MASILMPEDDGADPANPNRPPKRQRRSLFLDQITEDRARLKAASIEGFYFEDDFTPDDTTIKLLGSADYNCNELPAEPRFRDTGLVRFLRLCFDVRIVVMENGQETGQPTSPTDPNFYSLVLNGLYREGVVDRDGYVIRADMCTSRDLKLSPNALKSILSDYAAARVAYRRNHPSQPYPKIGHDQSRQTLRRAADEYLSKADVIGAKRPLKAYNAFLMAYSGPLLMRPFHLGSSENTPDLFVPLPPSVPDSVSASDNDSASSSSLSSILNQSLLDVYETAHSNWEDACRRQKECAATSAKRTAIAQENKRQARKLGRQATNAVQKANLANEECIKSQDLLLEAVKENDKALAEVRKAWAAMDTAEQAIGKVHKTEETE